MAIMVTSSVHSTLFLEAKINFQLYLYLSIWHGFLWLIPVDTEEPSLLIAQLLHLRLTLLSNQNLFNSS